MAEALQRWRSSKEGAKWQQDRARLPVLAIKQDLLTQLQQHDVVVVSGDTGCGKTTQVCALYIFFPLALLDCMCGLRQHCGVCRLTESAKESPALCGAERGHIVWQTCGKAGKACS